MSRIDDGGPAFPVDSILPRDEDGHFYNREISSAGMSMRDYMAVHARPETDIDGGIPNRCARVVMSGPPPSQQPGEEVMAYELRSVKWWIEAEARVRYMHADAMLKVRGMKL